MERELQVEVGKVKEGREFITVRVEKIGEGTVVERMLGKGKEEERVDRMRI